MPYFVQLQYNAAEKRTRLVEEGTVFHRVLASLHLQFIRVSLQQKAQQNQQPSWPDIVDFRCIVTNSTIEGPLPESSVDTQRSKL